MSNRRSQVRPCQDLNARSPDLDSFRPLPLAGPATKAQALLPDAGTRPRRDGLQSVDFQVFENVCNLLGF